MNPEQRKSTQNYHLNYKLDSAKKNFENREAKFIDLSYLKKLYAIEFD